MTPSSSSQSSNFSTLESNKLFSVKDKVALITGGSRGVGLMMAQGLVVNGAHVIITSRNAKQCDMTCDLLNKMAQTIGANAGSCLSIPTDVATEDGCRFVVSKIQELADSGDKRLQGGVHILINNAGTNWAESIETYPDSAWDKVLALNVKSVFHMTKHTLPLLKKAAETSGETSSVITTGSINGVCAPNLETYAYSTSKAAVHHLTKHLADRLAKERIRVNCIALGIVPTKMTHETLENFGELILENVPLGRAGSAEDLTSIVLYLGSKASSWMTGALLPLDGGALIKSHI